MDEHDRLWVALLLPFREPGLEVDEEGLRRLVQYFLGPRFVAAGGALVVNPEAGEVYTLSRAEKRRNVEVVVEEVRGRVPVFAGVIDVTTRGCIEVAEDARSAGADGLFLLPPIGTMEVTGSWDPERYPDVWADMCRAISDAVPLPALVHPVARNSFAYGIGLPLSATLRMLERVPAISGWKMTYSYDGYRVIARALRLLDRHVAILGAAAVHFHEALATGQMDGTLTGAFCYALEPMLEHIEAWRREDLAAAREVWNGGLAELHEYVYADWGRLHIRYKLACWLRGLIDSPLMRPPMPRPTLEEAVALRSLLALCGLEVRPERELRSLADGQAPPRPARRRAAAPRRAGKTPPGRKSTTAMRTSA